MNYNTHTVKYCFPVNFGSFQSSFENVKQLKTHNRTYFTHSYKEEKTTMIKTKEKLMYSLIFWIGVPASNQLEIENKYSNNPRSVSHSIGSVHKKTQ